MNRPAADARTTLAAVRDFWFGAPGPDGVQGPREAWWQKDDTFDDAVRAHCLAAHEAACARTFEHLIDQAEPCLTVCLLFDQVPRNVFRGTPRVYATDDRALALAIHAVDRGLDREIDPVRRTFFYTPFEHAEDLRMQDRAVALFSTIRDTEQDPEAMFHAKRHREIIERFGRFPHRNAILGRKTTRAETEFLKEPWSSY